MIAFAFTGWKRLEVKHLPKVVRGWLTLVGDSAQASFVAGMLGPHSGRLYRRAGGRFHRASINRPRAEFPASDSGELLASRRRRQTGDSITIGTTATHAIYLRAGTGRMRRRKMSDDAMVDGIRVSRRRLRGWVQFQNARGVRRA